MPVSSRWSCLQGTFCAESARGAEAGGGTAGTGQVFWGAQEDGPSASTSHTCLEVRTNLSPAGSLSQSFCDSRRWVWRGQNPHRCQAGKVGEGAPGSHLAHSTLAVPLKTMISLLSIDHCFSELMSGQNTFLIWFSLCPPGCWPEGKPC